MLRKFRFHLTLNNHLNTTVIVKNKMNSYNYSLRQHYSLTLLVRILATTIALTIKISVSKCGFLHFLLERTETQHLIRMRNNIINIESPDGTAKYFNCIDKFFTFIHNHNPYALTE